MDNLELHNILSTNHHTKRVYASVLPIDLLPKDPPPMSLRPYAMVINLAPFTRRSTTKASTEHWVVLYLESKKYSEYFDSMILEPPTNIKKLLINDDYLLSNKQLQDYLTSTCGAYCVYYVFMKSIGYSMQAILDKFTEDYISNDVAVTYWINQKFNLNKHIYDGELITKHLTYLLKTKLI